MLWSGRIDGRIVSRCFAAALGLCLIAGCPSDDENPTETGNGTTGGEGESQSASASQTATMTATLTATTGESDSASATGSTGTPGTATDATTGTTSSGTGTDTATGTDTDPGTGTDTGSGVEPVSCLDRGGNAPPAPGLAPWVSAGTDYASSSHTAGELSMLDDPEAGGGVFIEPPTTGGVTIECDVWAQDCPEGEKCMPWANDGGSSWNATRCSPIDPDPDQVGEPCVVEGSGVSGVDSCDLGAMCWGVDPETNEGTCVAMCTGSEANPVCAEGTTCSISNDGVLILCLPVCNPLVPEDCPAGQGCFPVGAGFLCAPDASGDMGAVGDPCQYVNACDPGNVCVSAELVPGCDAGAAGCCSATCMVPDNGDCLAGQECVAWFEEGAEPATCLEGVGVCITP